MILSVTEEQKKVIESQGYMVVQFKLWCKKMIERFAEAFQKFIDGMKEVIPFLQDMMSRAFDSVKEISGRISQELKPYIEDLKTECNFDYGPRKKYPFVRSLGRKYQPNFSYKLIYHRCRDRC